MLGLLSNRIVIGLDGVRMPNIVDYYNSIDEGHRLQRNNSRRIEYFTTLKNLKDYAKIDYIVADIGAGEGAYTFELANVCKKVNAFDIVPKHVVRIDEIANEKQIANVTATLKSILEIDSKHSNTYNMVLCLGPYYHFRTKAERQKCLMKCFEILKSDGYLFISYINRDAAIATYYKFQKYITKEIFDELQKEEYQKEFGFDPFMDISFFADPDMIERELAENGFEICANIGTDGIYSLVEKQMSDMTEEEFNALYSYHLRNCEKRYLLGLNNHGLAICRKRSG